MSHQKADRYYRSDGVHYRKFASDNNRIAEMLRKQKPADSVPAPVTLKEPKK